MNYKVRALSIRTKEEGFAEFKKIGADAAGCNIMINKTSSKNQTYQNNNWEDYLSMPHFIFKNNPL